MFSNELEFSEAEAVIWPDLNHRFPGVPIILVATKCDLRYEEDEQLWQIDEDSASSKSKFEYFNTRCRFFELFAKSEFREFIKPFRPLCRTKVQSSDQRICGSTKFHLNGK